MTWRPVADLPMLRARARMLAQIRYFFAEQGVMEVETPQLASACAPEPNIQPFSTEYSGPNPRRLYLQSSPELAMKRLLAAGSGPIYQISRAFRDGEAGHLHNPEFTMLEWYRPDFSQHDLMDEIEKLLQMLLGIPHTNRITYVELFLRETGLHPLNTALEELRAYTAQQAFMQTTELDRDTCLQLILTHQLEPHLGQPLPLFVYDFPATQAALARLKPDDKTVAERFELYIQGMEIANGFHELTDADEQRARFQQELAARQMQNLPQLPLDERFLTALASGLPDCAGVALGVDRLLMVLTGKQDINDVLAFPLSCI